MPGLVKPGGGGSAVSRPPAEAIRALKNLVRTVLELGDDVPVLVQQLECRESGCAPVETVIVEMGPPPRTWKFAKPVADLSADEVHAALADDPGREAHDHHK